MQIYSGRRRVSQPIMPRSVGWEEALTDVEKAGELKWTESELESWGLESWGCSIK
jgi:hypothetical protein